MAILGVEKLSIEEVHRFDWRPLDDKMKKWIQAVKLVVPGLLSIEKRLCEEIFYGSDLIKEDCFLERLLHSGGGSWRNREEDYTWTKIIIIMEVGRALFIRIRFFDGVLSGFSFSFGCLQRCSWNRGLYGTSNSIPISNLEVMMRLFTPRKTTLLLLYITKQIPHLNIWSPS